MPGATQQYSSGSVHVFCEGPSTGKFYLGTCEQMPQDSRNPEYELVMNDLTGSKKPLDMAWEGEDATVSCILTRFKHLGWNLLETKPRPTVNAQGEWSLADMGAMMALEGLAWKIWLVYAFGAAMYNKAAYTSQNMPPGRFYPQCAIWAPQSDETGSQPMKRQVIFYAWAMLSSGAIGGPATPWVPNATPTKQVLFSTAIGDFSGLPAIT